MTFDESVPTLTTVSIASNNADTTLAKVGDTVKISITSSEALIGNPTVTIDGNVADSVINTGGNDYEATRVMQIADTEGPVVFSIDFADAVANAGVQVTAVTDATSVTFDEAAPTVDSVTPTTLSDSDAGLVSVTITFNKAMDTGTNPSPTITGLTTDPYTITGSTWTVGDTEWTGTFIFNDDHESATGTYNISGFKDASGNTMAADSTNTVAVDTQGPIITGAVLDSDNGYVDVTFSQGVYDTAGGVGAVKVSDFTLDFNKNGGNATAVSISSVTKNDNNALVGGESVIRIHLSMTGIPVGVETIEIQPVTNGIYNVGAIAAVDTETTGVLTLNAQIVPVKEGEVIIRNNIINPAKGDYTILNFRLKKSTKVKITVYDLAGNPVKVLYNKKGQAGMNEVRWYGKNKKGKKVVQGVYYVVIMIGKERHVKKVLIVR